MQNRGKTFIWIGIGILAAFMGIWAPGRLVNWQAEDYKNVIHQTSGSNYYNGSQQAVVMTLYERMKLMSGAWDSSWQEVDSETVDAMENAPKQANLDTILETDGELELVGYCYQNRESILTLAEAGMQTFYEAGMYPKDVVSGYANWYRPIVHLYQYSDSVFEAYTCYAWLVELDYYDGSCKHLLLIDDTSGLILAGGMWNLNAGTDTVWLQKLEEQSMFPDEIIEYYRGGNPLNGTALNITNAGSYQPQYPLWEEQYQEIADNANRLRLQGKQSYLLSEKQLPVSYEEAVSEVQTITDNDKFLYTIEWWEGQCRFSLTPFTIQIEK